VRSGDHAESHVIYAQSPLQDHSGPWGRLSEVRTISADGYIERKCRRASGESCLVSQSSSLFLKISGVFYRLRYFRGRISAGEHGDQEKSCQVLWDVCGI
jgi:hypothetical protein